MAQTLHTCPSRTQGTYQEKRKLPFVPGGEVSGVVTEVGLDVRTVRVRESVVAVLWAGGAFAEEVVVPESYVLSLPSAPYTLSPQLRALSWARGIPFHLVTSHHNHS